MTDQDTMVYIRNAALALSRIAQEKNILINITASKDGGVYGLAGRYEFIKSAATAREVYEYRPVDDVGAWREVQPSQIRFGKEPHD